MKRNLNYQKNQIKIVLNRKPKVLLKLLKKKLPKRKSLFNTLFFLVFIYRIATCRYNYVAGGEGDKGLVGAVKEKATGAYVYFICTTKVY